VPWKKDFLQMPKTSLFTSSPFILPYEPGYTGHWEAEKRRKETKEWLCQREREIECCGAGAKSLLPAPNTRKEWKKRRPDFGRHFDSIER
jgi:hypothetical protein